MNPFGKIINKSLDVFGNQMKKTSITFQFESALAAYGIMWCSITFFFFFQIYTMIFVSFSWWNVFYMVNALCGILIIYSMLVSTYMSYLQIKAVTEIGKSMEFKDVV